LNIGDTVSPYRWEASSIPIQIFTVGNLVTLNVPDTLTTMGGRRMRNAIQTVFKNASLFGTKEPLITIGGLANSHSHYVTTFEEYQAQRYEGAATLYGPHTLAIYIQEFSRLAMDMIHRNKRSSSSRAPEDLLVKQIILESPALFDSKPSFRKFGEVLTDVMTTGYLRGEDRVLVRFQGANPRNNLQLQGTFLTVRRVMSDSKWKTVASDSNWETKFHWKSVGPQMPKASVVTIEWEIPRDAEFGKYCICYHGHWKEELTEKITAFTGCSSSFEVIGKLV